MTPTKRSNDSAAAREYMVRHQIEARGIHDPRVLTALRRVPRHAFVPSELQSEAYADHPLPIGQGQTISQPYIVALMLKLLELEGGERVLDIGTGCGYQAAVLAEIGADVISLEIVPELAASARERLRLLGYDSIQVIEADGQLGWPEAAPYAGIVVAAAPATVPSALTDQLAMAGRLVIPVGQREQSLLQIVRTPSGLVERVIAPVAFVPLV